MIRRIFPLRFAATTRSRLTLLVLAVLLPVAVFASVLFWRFAIAERLRYRDEASVLAEQITGTIDRELTGLEAALEALATSPSLQSKLDLATFYTQAQAVLQSRGTSIVLRDRNGQGLIYTGLPLGSPIPPAKDAAVIDADRAVIQNGRPVVSDLYEGTVSHRRLVLIDVPVIRNGVITYTLNISIDPALLSQILTRLVQRGWLASVIDQNDRLIARSRNAGQYLGQLATPDLRRETTGTAGTWVGTNLEGQRVIGAFVRSELSGWRIAVGVPFKVVEAPFQRFVIVLVISSILILALSAALAAGVARTISGPLQRLSDAATRLGRGQPVPPLHTGLRDADEVGRALSDAYAEIQSREAELLASEERFRAAVRAVEGVIWTVDAAGHMTGEQQGWSALTGQSPEQWRGAGWSEAVHPDDRQPTIDAWDAAVRGARTFVWEHRVCRSDGVWRRFSIRAVPVHDSSGSVREWVGVHTDVTDEFEAKTRLAESQARLQAVFEAVPVGIVVAMAPTGEIIDGNKQIERILRHAVFRSATVEGYREWISFHPDGRAVQPEEYPLARVIRGGEEHPELEVIYRRGDGTQAWIRIIGAPIRGEDGHLTGGVVAVVDIDREKRAEAQLRELNATLERRVEETSAERDRIWRTSTELMLVACFDSTITAANPAWATTLGWTEDELVGSSFSTLIHPDDRMRTFAETARLAEGYTTLRFENRYRHKDGSYRLLSWTAVPAAEMIHAIGRDVTAEKEAEAALRRTEDQLRQSQKMEVVGQLTGGIAHDFNNLLTVVTGNIELAQRRLEAIGSDARLARTLCGALEGAQRAATLTHRLLAFSRQSPLRPMTIRLNDVVGGMLDLIGRTLSDQIKLETALDPALWLAEADQNQVENAILNLCVNARDAMAAGGSLLIQTQNRLLAASDPAVLRGEARAGEYATVAIQDTGIGMSAEVRQRAFEPFFTTKPVGKGTGLGLSQVFGFMRQSNGTVTLDSSPGEGTSVSLLFPRMVAASDEPASQGATTGSEEIAGSGETILIIEDQDMVREFTVEALQGSGYQILSASDGASGLALLAANPTVSLLFTDVVLAGGMSGREVAVEARRLRPDLKILYTTGYARDEIIHNGRLDADVDLLTKPFTAAMLVSRVGQALGTKA